MSPRKSTPQTARQFFINNIVEPLENCAGDARRTKLHTCRLQQVNRVMNHADAAPVQAISKIRQEFIYIPINIKMIFEIILTRSYTYSHTYKKF